jgi:hypothetical protein
MVKRAAMSNAEASATPSYILQTKATRTKIAERRAAVAQTDVQDAISLSNKPVIKTIKKKKEKKTKKKEPAHAVAGSDAVGKSEEEKAAAEETQALDEEVASKPTRTAKKRRKILK